MGLWVVEGLGCRGSCYLILVGLGGGGDVFNEQSCGDLGG